MTMGWSLLLQANVSNLTLVSLLFCANNTLGAPSMMVADSVKMLDMSLPSYGDISDSKTSVENTKSLYLDPSTTKGMGIAASQKKKGIPMSSVLPSMGKESADKKKKKPSSSVGDYNF